MLLRKHTWKELKKIKRIIITENKKNYFYSGERQQDLFGFGTQRNGF